ncbi:MAG: TVP38/TMEM64 family protein [Eubacterium sp.]
MKGFDFMLEYFNSIEAVKHFLLGFGGWTPLIYFLFQILQVIIAPIPGGTTTLVGGALFGGLWGFLLSMTGILIGSAAAFGIAKKLGRPFILRFIGSKWLEKFENIRDSRLNMVLFLIFLFPGFPDDLFCYLAGLSKMRFKTFMFIAILGRIPGFLLTTLVGAGIMKEDPVQLIIVLLIYGIFAGVLLFNKKRMETYLENSKKNKGDPS